MIVVFIGPESSGKTTLCEKLSKKYNTVWVREMCRVMAEEKVGVIDPSVCNAFTFTMDDFMNMAERQNKEEEEKSKDANKILFCDNDAFSIGVWCERYLGVYHEFETTKDKLYILTKPNVAFVQDGLRDGEHIREWMYERFVEVLEGKEYHVIDAEDYEDRLNQAIDIIETFLKRFNKG
jgi:NadR type nicotinamide-nucleotide adenylyltransferase